MNEENNGEISPRKNADFIIIDGDHVSADVHSLKKPFVLGVYVSGKELLRKGF